MKDPHKFPQETSIVFTETWILPGQHEGSTQVSSRNLVFTETWKS